MYIPRLLLTVTVIGSSNSVTLRKIKQVWKMDGWRSPGEASALVGSKVEFLEWSFTRTLT